MSSKCFKEGEPEKISLSKPMVPDPKAICSVLDMEGIIDLAHRYTRLSTKGTRPTMVLDCCLKCIWFGVATMVVVGVVHDDAVDDKGKNLLVDGILEFLEMVDLNMIEF